jgi:hypothetical protein
MSKIPSKGQAAPNDDRGVVVALLERLRTQRLPRVLDIKTKVDRGERLESFDIDFLNEIFADATALQSKWEQHPELNEIIGKISHLYREITERALSNEGDHPDATRPGPHA